MNRRLIITILLLFFAFTGFTRHLKGGFFTYTYLSQTATEIRYHVTLTLYMECNATGGQIDPTIPFTFFEKGTNRLERTVDVSIKEQFLLSKTADEKCISGDQTGCYYKIVVYDLATITLPLNSNGYTVSYQRCCRISGINNITNSQDLGNTYSIDIPGKAVGLNVETNSSPRFFINDSIVVCGNSELNYSFLAEDPNGDVLRYEFCNAWVGGASSPQSQIAPNPASAPPYTRVP